MQCERKHASVYNVIADVVFATPEVWAIDFGIKVFCEARPQRFIRSGDWVEGEIWIGVELHTVVVWGDGIPELIPEVDMLLIIRDELAPVLANGVHQKDKCLVLQNSVNEILAPLSEDGYVLRVRKPTYNVAPDAVQKFIRSLPQTTDHIAGVAMDSILDGELVHKITKLA